MVLASVAGWAAIKHFPTAQRKAVVTQIKKFFDSPEKFGIVKGELKKLRGGLQRISQVVAEQPWAHVHRDDFGTVLGSSKALTDPTITRTLDILRQQIERTSAIAQAAGRKSVLPARFTAPIPQDNSIYRRMTIGDLLSPSGAWNESIWGAKPKGAEALESVFSQLAKIPGLPKNVRENLFKSIEVDAGLFVRRGAGGVMELANINAVLPGNLLKGMRGAAAKARTQSIGEQIRSGGIFARAGNWLTELMLPTELLHQGPSVAMLGKNAARGYMGGSQPAVVESLFLQGSVYPVFKSGAIGESVKSGVRLGSTGTRMGMMAGVRERESFLRTTAGAGMNRAERYIRDRKLDPEGWRAAAIRVGQTLGVGPQFIPGKAAGKQAQAADAALRDELLPNSSIPGFLKNLVVQPWRSIKDYAKGIAGASPMPVDPNRPAHYAYTAGQGWNDYANLLLHRVGSLFTSTTKLGVRPGVHAGETAARWAGIGVAAWAGVSGAKYVDYHMQRLTGTGPISAPLQAYTAARVGFQTAMAGTGIQQGADYLENLMPGIINSPASRAIRAIAVTRLFTGRSPLGGTKFLGAANKANAARFGQGLASQAGYSKLLGRKLGTAAAYAMGATQLGDLTQSPRDLAAVYAGEKNVQVREGRFWGLGSNPYTGGRVLYERPHLIPTYLSGAKDIAVHGSRGAAFSDSLFPTPESWFGLKPLLDPYAVEKRNYLNRPYPQTSPMFQEVPLLGPLLGATIGEIIKPTQRWHGSYWGTGGLRQGFPTAGPPGAAAAMGLAPMPGRVGPTDPNRIIGTLGKQIDILRDFIGMPGFLLGAAKQQLTGRENFEPAGRQVAASGRMTSWARSYYDMELGGLLGMTEMGRRFLPHRQRSIETVNPIANQAPAWLPGSFSAFPGDKDATKNFHRGDPYADIPHGESRLPGPGYEALHRLHSGIPGVYDPMDRWRILKDVAPTSEAFRHYDALVRSWAATGRKQSQQKEGGLTGPYGLRSLRGVVSAVLDGDTVVVNIKGKVTTVRLVGGDTPEVSHTGFENALEEAGAVGSRTSKSTHRKIADPTREYLGVQATTALREKVLGKSVLVDPITVGPHGRLIGRLSTSSGHDISTDLEKAFPAYDLSKAQQAEIISARSDLERRFEPFPFSRRIFSNSSAAVPRSMRNLTSSSLESINQAIRRDGEFSGPEKVVGNIWERISHVSLPGPLNWPVNKLFGQRDAFEAYRSQQLTGNFANWATPIESFAKPWAQQTVGMFNPSYVPRKVRQQQTAEAVVDTMQYARMQVFEQRANQGGYSELGRHYKEQQSRTVTGAIISGNRRFIRGALPRRERGFYAPFSQATDPAKRQRILNVVSPEFGAVLRGAWGQDTRGESIARQNLVNSSGSSIPKDWAGWHPDVPMSSMKVKVADSSGWDIHDLGLTNRDRYLAEEIFGGYVPTAQGSMTWGTHSRSSVTRASPRMHLSPDRVTVMEMPGAPQLRINVRRNRSKFRKLYAQYDSPAATGMRY